MNAQDSLQDKIDDLIAREEYLYEKIEKEQTLALVLYKQGRIQGKLKLYYNLYRRFACKS